MKVDRLVLDTNILISATGDQDLLTMHPWQGIQILNPAQALEIT